MLCLFNELNWRKNPNNDKKEKNPEQKPKAKKKEEIPMIWLVATAKDIFGMH